MDGYINIQCSSKEIYASQSNKIVYLSKKIVMHNMDGYINMRCSSEEIYACQSNEVAVH